ELAPVDTELADRVGVAHADAVEPLHDEHAPRGEIMEYGRYPHVAGTVEVGGDVGRVARFDLEVELLAQAFRELVGEITHAIFDAPGRALLDHRGQLIEYVEVAVHGIGDARSLHFHDHLLPAVQACSMRLPDRRRRQR